PSYRLANMSDIMHEHDSTGDLFHRKLVYGGDSLGANVRRELVILLPILTSPDGRITFCCWSTAPKPVIQRRMTLAMTVYGRRSMNMTNAIKARYLSGHKP